MKQMNKFFATLSISLAIACTSFAGKVQITDLDQGEVMQVNSDGTIPTQISKPLTAFGELSVAPSTPVFQGIFEYTVDNTELNDNTTTSNATVTQATGLAVLQTGAIAGGTAKLTSKRQARYRPGQGGMSRFTSVFGTAVTGTEALIGLADVAATTNAFKNGYMIGYIGTTFGFHRFQNDVVTTVAIADWDDPLDGSGASGMDIDLTKGNVWQIEFQYLGFGSILLSVEDDSSGGFVPAHRILYANANTTPSVYNPNFKHTIWVDNGVTTSNITLKSASYAFFIQGKTKYQEIHQPQQTSGNIEKASVVATTNLFTIRNRSTYAGKQNFIDVLIENVGASIEASSANNIGTIRLVRNATLGSSSYSNINTNNSVIEIDTSSTSVTGGTELFIIPLAGKNAYELINLSDFDILLHPGDTISITGSSANSATVNANILWKELF